uniref:ribonuclease H n=1 Tax=Caenorhabditis tropicalis TaxID=1561998 RepID=A0A1I7TC76_9PELO
MMLREAIVYTDGSCANQGLSNARAGYGVFWGDNHPNNFCGRVDGLQDNNRAELRGAHQAIKTAIKQEYDSIVIHTDSQYVCDAIAGASGFASSAQNRDLIQSIYDLSRRIKTTVIYTEGHSGDQGNEEANKLAMLGAKI